jgi:L-alanine-DL-glutamate epimerase-like enolase superfamily enzyme
MKITHIETILLSRMHELERQWITSTLRIVKADCAIVLIHTDEGLTGIGEACAYGNPARIREWAAWLAPELVGKDPLRPETVPHPNGRTAAYDCTISGIDAALWDLRGQVEGKRVSQLLNRKYRKYSSASSTPGALEKVRLYASSGCRYDWRYNPNQLIEEALGYISQGYTAMKLRLGTQWAWDGVTVDRFLGLMRELAQEVNGRMELMLDGNQRLSEDQALEIAKELSRLNFAWFEEPIPQADIDGYVRLNRAVEVPITGGEQFTTVEQFRPYLERHAYNIVQPDAGWCGISEAMRIAEVADRYGVDLCPHNWHNGLMTMANAHLVAALPHPKVLELCMIQGPLQWDILAEPPQIQDGWLLLPERPGLGVSLAEDLAGKFPYIEGNYYITVER